MTKHASEDTAKGECPKQLSSTGWVGSNSELTPSESLATTDDVRLLKSLFWGTGM